MDKQDSSDHDHQQGQSDEKQIIKKMSLDKHFGKADKSIKLIAFQQRTNFLKQKIKITSELIKNRYQSSDFQPKIKIEWRPPFYGAKTTLTLMPYNKKYSKCQLQVQCKLNSGFSSSLSVNSQIQGNLKLSFSNQFQQIKYKVQTQLQKKKQLKYKWGLEFRKSFVHGFFLNYFKALASSVQFNFKDSKPQIKYALMSQATNQYKFFSQLKLGMQKHIQSKAKFQFQLPKGSCAVSTEIKTTVASMHEITNSYILKLLLVPKKKIKLGLSIDEKLRFETFYEQQKVKQLFNSDCSVCLSNKNIMLKLMGKKGKLRYEIGAQLKPFQPKINLIGMKISYNMDYNSDKRSSLRSQENNQDSKDNIQMAAASLQKNQNQNHLS